MGTQALGVVESRFKHSSAQVSRCQIRDKIAKLPQFSLVIILKSCDICDIGSGAKRQKPS